MKLAVISDIHSNFFALEAVLEDVRKQRVDDILNLGDIFYGPIAPRETYDLLMEYDCKTISGNQDRMIHEASAEEIEKNPTLRFVIEELGEEAVAWIKSLPFDLQLSEAVYMCHGSPLDDLEYLLEDVSAGFPRIRMDTEIVASLGEQRSDLIFCGHTHIPRVVHTSSGQLIINPGSVGLPAYADDEPVVHVMENGSPQAAYCIVEREATGWRVQQMSVPYAHQRAVKKAKELEREDWGAFLSSGRGGNP